MEGGLYGPPPEDPALRAAHVDDRGRVAHEDLIQQMDVNGPHLVKERTFLPYQYFLVFQAKALDQ